MRSRHLKRLVRDRVVAHTRHGQSIRGVLVGEHRDCIVLDAAEYLGEAQVEKLSGQAVVPLDNLAWLQVLSDDGS